MSQVLEQIKNRRSIRKYKPDEVPQDLLDQFIEAGLYAASGKNLQSAIIIQVTNKELRDEISRMNAQIMGRPEGHDPFYGAPVMLIVLGKKDQPNHVADGSLVMGNLMLAAHELGLGSCWINRAKEEFDTQWGRDLLKSLGIEGEYEGIGHCALGYIDGEVPEAAPPQRKPGVLHQVSAPTRRQPMHQLPPDFLPAPMGLSRGSLSCCMRLVDIVPPQILGRGAPKNADRKVGKSCGSSSHPPRKWWWIRTALPWTGCPSFWSRRSD